MVTGLTTMASREYSLMVERTLVLGVDNKYHRKTLTEEHISIVSESGSSNVSHTTPQSGSSKDITESLVASLKDLNTKTQNLKVVGCDGTNVNTGHTAGVIRRLEESFKHPAIHCSGWYFCSMPMSCPCAIYSRHSTELLLTHAREFSGSIGKRSVTCSEQPDSSFEPVQLTE